jgi:hypothetical protein
MKLLNAEVGDVVGVEHKGTQFYLPDIIIRMRQCGIRYAFQRGIPTHVGICSGVGVDTSEILVTSMRASGVVTETYPMSSEHVIMFGKPDPTPEMKLIVEAMTELRKAITGYAWRELLSDSVGYWMPDIFAKWIDNMVRSPKRMYCSEFCAAVYEQAGWKHSILNKGFVTPYDWYEVL